MHTHDICKYIIWIYIFQMDKIKRLELRSSPKIDTGCESTEGMLVQITTLLFCMFKGQ